MIAGLEAEDVAAAFNINLERKKNKYENQD
jgi:hypothetical protein